MQLKFKRNLPLLVCSVVTLSVLVLTLGNLRVGAFTTHTSNQKPGSASQNVALFDSSVVHSLQISLSETDYNQMLASYQTSGAKDYVRADLVIDGVRINSVGLRLKGNASLRSALGGQGGGPGGGQGGGKRPGGNGNPPGNGPQPGLNANGAQPQPPAGAQPGGKMSALSTPVAGQNAPQANAPASQGGGPGGFGQPGSGGETKIPFLIKFDEYIEGQNYQGYTELALRTYGTTFNAAMLNEPLTNSVANLAGLPATQTAYAGLQINEAAETLYVLSEVINSDYLAKYFDQPNGLLYKAEIGANLAYQGADPGLYTSSFSQETHKKTIDFAPLIAFTRFISQADEATFESDLPKWLDVEAFATYLAVNDLLVNTDSMLGMDNNYYLYYDASRQRFTLLMWDANESLGKLGGSATYDLDLANAGGGPGGNRGGNSPQASALTTATANPGPTAPNPGGRNGGNRGGGGPGGGKNALLTRFMANATFKALYEQKVKEVYAQAFQSGALTAEVEHYAALIHSVNDQRALVEREAYDQAVQQALNFIEQRLAYLKTTELLGQ